MRSSTLALVPLLASFATTVRAGPAAAAPSSLLGAWKEEGDAARTVVFEPERVRLLEGGRRSHFYARYSDGQVSLWSWARKRVWKVTVKDDVLTLDMFLTTSSFRRIAEEPEALRIQPVPFGKPAPIPPERVRDIRAELRRRQIEDQAVRKDDSRSGEMQRIDADNTKYLRALLGEVGWIDSSRFGRDAADAAFLIVQHSGDVALMSAALPEIEKDVKAKALDPQNFALLHDRLALNLGRKQRYGTQLASGTWGGLVVLPLEDRANVERIREEVGLFPLSEYLRGFAAKAGDKEPTFLEWD